MPDEALRYFADETKRESVKRIMADGWQLPRITGKKICTYSQVRPVPDLDPEKLKALLQNMIALRIGRG